MFAIFDYNKALIKCLICTHTVAYANYIDIAHEHRDSRTRDALFNHHVNTG